MFVFDDAIMYLNAYGDDLLTIKKDGDQRTYFISLYADSKSASDAMGIVLKCEVFIRRDAFLGEEEELQLAYAVVPDAIPELDRMRCVRELLRMMRLRSLRQVFLLHDKTQMESNVNYWNRITNLYYHNWFIRSTWMTAEGVRA